MNAATQQQHAQPILSAHGIVNRFGKQEVHDKIGLDVVAGEIIGIAGGSGSGKSVLLKTLTGLHKPNAGKVLLDGKKVETLSQAEKARCFPRCRWRRISCCRYANIPICRRKSRKKSRR